MSRFAGVSMRAGDVFYTTTLSTHLNSESIAIRVKPGECRAMVNNPMTLFRHCGFAYRVLLRIKQNTQS